MNNNEKQSLIGMILFNVNINNFLGFGFDKFGCAIFIYDKKENKIINKSIRPIYVAFEDEKYFYYFKLQGANEKEINFSYLLKEKNKGLPFKDSIIKYDNLHRVEKKYLNIIIDKNHNNFKFTKNLDYQKQKGMLSEFYNNLLIGVDEKGKPKIENLTILEIITKNLKKELKPKFENKKIYVLGAKILKTNRTLLDTEEILNSKNRNSRTFHPNRHVINKLIENHKINKIEDLEHIIKTVENHLKFLDQKIKEESKQKTFNTAVFYFKNNKSRGFDKVLNSLEPNEQKELWGIIKQTDKWKEMFKQFKIQKCIEFYEKNDEWFLKIFDTLTPKEKGEFENKLLEKERKKKDEEKIKAKEKYNDEGREK